MSKDVRSRVRKAVVLYLIGVFLAMIWPVYSFFSRIEPMVFGLPFSLFYLVCLLVLSFLVLLSYYLWEDRRGEID